jgi:hypothetical protein
LGVGVKKQKKRGANDFKKRGEWVELKFLAEAAQRNLPTSKPYGDSENFDVVVGRPGKFVGVQVKSTSYLQSNGYHCNLTPRSHQPYAAGSFDFLAAYIVPENVWYIIPSKVIHGKGIVMLYPNLPTAKYEQYREAWNLLQEAVGVKEEPSLPAEESAPPNRMESRMMGAFNLEIRGN